MANSALVISSLDFDNIRSSLADYLRAKPQFKDIDYEGSNISVLLDLLAYNTHLNGFYTNMAISESFLDSAQLRDSVVSRAKELNYTPRSNRSATAYIDIQITPSDAPSSILIPKGTAFTARLDNDIYTFTTAENIITTSSQSYLASNVAIYEGVYVTETFTFAAGSKYILQNTNIDTSSLSVNIQTSNTDTSNSDYTQATSLIGLNSSSSVFFLQAADKGRYELIFGDGVLGKALSAGNIISATYRVSQGDAPNGISAFTLASSISGYPVTITTNTPAFGGMLAESIDSIKYNAPRHYQTQERAVTPEDYKTILKSQYPDIRTINVFGGEKLDPPKYGKVYISIDFNSFDGIPLVIKDSIESFISTKTPISIEPLVIAADYTYIMVDVSAEYNLNLTTQTVSDIQNTIKNAILAFNTSYLDNFNISFRYSKLAAAIDSSDASIITSNLITKVIKKVYPELYTPTQYTLEFQNALEVGSLGSSTFTYANVASYLKDTGLGEIEIATSEAGSEVTLLHVVGTIDYSTGKVILNLPEIQDYIREIEVYAKSKANDFSVYNNTILSIDPDDINITVTAVRK